MPARTFTSDYVEHRTLRDGTNVVLRLVMPADRELLRQGFERWSNESRYARFFSAKSHLTEEELSYLCDVDHESHFALGAVTMTDPAVGLGVARFIRLPDTELGAPVTAEAAIAVADDVHGQGLGRILFERLVAAAAERGIERFRCEVLGSNSSMKTLLDKLAPLHTTEVRSGVMSIDFDVPAPTASPQESVMYKFFRGIAKLVTSP